MGLYGKESKQLQIKYDEKLMYDLFRYGPNHVSKLSPEVQGCDLIEGQWGTVGSVICWHFTLDGNRGTNKEKINAIDEEKKLIQFKVIGGELLKAYKSFLITFQISSNNTVSFSVEYEKINENIPNPTAFLDLLVKVTRDIDTNHKDIPRLLANNSSS